ncbi:MAG: NAD-dependent epimerase/dehydratase family protein [Chloroflexota bacterium]
MKVLITGGLGRVGRAVAERLKDTHEIAVLDAAVGALADGKRVYAGSVSDRAAVVKAMVGADAVIHLAALYKYYPERHAEFIEVNYKGTFNVLEAAVECGVKKVVIASSICAYGFIFWHAKETPCYFPIDEEHPTNPTDLYGLTKLQSEQLCRAYAQRYGLRTVALRLATVWFLDDVDYTRRFFGWLREPGNAVNHIWNYVDARDVGQAFALALRHEGGPCDVFNVGADDVAADLDSLELIRRYYPDVPALKNADSFLWKPRAPLFGIARAKEVLGFAPEYTWRDYAAHLDSGSGGP